MGIYGTLFSVMAVGRLQVGLCSLGRSMRTWWEVEAKPRHSGRCTRTVPEQARRAPKPFCAENAMADRFLGCTRSIGSQRRDHSDRVPLENADSPGN